MVLICVHLSGSCLEDSSCHLTAVTVLPQFLALNDNYCSCYCTYYVSSQLNGQAIKWLVSQLIKCYSTLATADKTVAMVVASLTVGLSHFKRNSVKSKQPLEVVELNH